MNESRLVWALVFVFAAIAVSQVVLGALFTPVAFVIALPFAAAAYLLWYHVSGRMARNVRKRARRRSPWEDARARATAGEAGDRRAGAGPTGDGGHASGAGAGSMTAATAYATLDIGPDASAEEVQRAYREKVKETHPDRAGGDEEAFKRVTEAYQRLRAD